MPGLKVRMLDDAVLEVQESQLTFKGIITRFWYFDTKTWMQSRRGKEGDPCDQPMTETSIRWVKEVYLPKVATGAT